MASSEEQSGGQAGAWEPPRRRYYPVRPGAVPERPWLDRPPAERAQPALVEPTPATSMPATSSPATSSPASPGLAEVVPAGLGGLPAISGYATDIDPSGAGLGKASDLAVAVLSGLGALGPEQAGPATPTYFPVRARRVDVSQLSTGELRREAASCIDDNSGRAKRIINDWLKS
ncbi:MAG TPA: hypothetical protein VFN61_07475 [Acidimicrobiales bacterium]|nr:hypothetical protein [Acidimicrobiales bacterium]